MCTFMCAFGLLIIFVFSALVHVKLEQIYLDGIDYILQKCVHAL